MSGAAAISPMEPLPVPATLAALGTIADYVRRAAEAAGLDRWAAYRLRLAVDEIATNIVTHGYAESGLSGEVIVRAELTADTLTIILEDTAVPFDPRACRRPEHIDRPIDERPIGGLGVYMSIASIDRLDYEYHNGRNRNIFVMRRPPSDQPRSVGAAEG